jgi:hypothetical protein
MCLNETYMQCWVGKHWSDTFPLKNGLKKEMLYCNCFSTLLHIRMQDEVIKIDNCSFERWNS